MFGRTEDAIDEAKRLLACGLADQAAKLRLAEIGIGDDNDAEPVGPCGAHQLDGRLETIAMVSLGNELLLDRLGRSAEHTSELQSLMRISYAVFCLKKKKT